MATIELPNGIILDDQAGMAPTLQSHANRRGLARLRVFVATAEGVQAVVGLRVPREVVEKWLATGEWMKRRWRTNLCRS